MVYVHCRTVAKATISAGIHHWKQQIQALLFILFVTEMEVTDSVMAKRVHY